MTQPFHPNKIKTTRKLAEAAHHLRTALRAIEQAKKSASDWGEYGTIQHFERQLAEFLNSDNGEAGFDVYLLNKAKSLCSS